MVTVRTRCSSTATTVSTAIYDVQRQWRLWGTHSRRGTVTRPDWDLDHRRSTSTAIVTTRCCSTATMVSSGITTSSSTGSRRIPADSPAPTTRPDGREITGDQSPWGPAHRSVVSRFTTFFNCCEAEGHQHHAPWPGCRQRHRGACRARPSRSTSSIGPRTSAKGYVPAGYLVNGTGPVLCRRRGCEPVRDDHPQRRFLGGLPGRPPPTSHCVAIPLPAWVSRPPWSTRSIDYRFTNNTPTPVTIHTSCTGSSVTVEFWGYQGGWQVSGHHPLGYPELERITVLDRRWRATPSG